MSSDQKDVGELLEAAGAQALRLGHSHVGSEHLLLALLQREGSVATDALWSLRVDLLTMRAAVEASIPAQSRLRAATPKLTPRARSIIARASDVAAQRGDAASGEHVLLALIKERDGIAGRMLLELDVSPDVLQARLLELMEEGGPRTPG